MATPEDPANPTAAAADPTAAALARLYDLDLADDPGDLDLYLALADRAAGAVLELAVGSGRLAVPLAMAGHPVTGVDIDPAMLDRARAAAGDLAEPAALATGRRRGRGAAAGRLQLVEADILGLALPSAGAFGLAFIALNSIFLLASRTAQREAVRTLARHLAPGGLAVVDIWQPTAEDLARFDGRLLLEGVREDRATGRLVTKVSSALHDASSQVVTLTTIYEEAAQGEAPRRWIRSDRLRLLSADELLGMAEDAGLEIETLAGDYDLAPMGPGTDRAILVATRP